MFIRIYVNDHMARTLLHMFLVSNILKDNYCWLFLVSQEDYHFAFCDKNYHNAKRYFVASQFAIHDPPLVYF